MSLRKYASNRKSHDAVTRLQKDCESLPIYEDFLGSTHPHITGRKRR